MTKKSKIFYSSEWKLIGKEVLKYLKLQRSYLSERSIESPRAVGDAIQDLVSDGFGKIIKKFSNRYSSKFARRSMADLAFNDKEGFYYIVDVKTHRLDSGFNMLNLTSVERLAKFYEDDSNYFVVLKIDYLIDKSAINIKNVIFIPIEFISWESLTLGALGWGQIQIANSNFVKTVTTGERKDWMLKMCENLFEFYPKEIDKIGGRIEYFKKVKKYWENKKT